MSMAASRGRIGVVAAVTVPGRALGSRHARWWFALGWMLASCSSTPDPKGIEDCIARPVTVKPWTSRVLLVGDTQTQTSFGRSFFERSSLADRIIPSSMRSPLVDEFAASLLLQACAAAGPSGPVIHLGDAANSSCVDELETAFGMMDQCRSASQWAFVPGNHEGFLMGNTDDLCDFREWQVACYGSAPLAKDAVVRRLRARALAQGHEPYGPWGDAVEKNVGDAPCPDGGTFWRGMGTFGALVEQSAACIHEPADQRFRSFFAQLVRLPAPAPVAGQPTPPAVYGVLLDTTQYEARPALLPLEENAGMVGSVLDNQWKVVEGWIAPRASHPIVLFGHHRIQELTPKAREAVLKLAGEHANVVLYVSAHTHSEAFYQHALPGDSQDRLVEMNVASLIDFPNSYRDVQLVSDGSRVLLSTSLSPSSLRKSEDVPRCEPGWLPDDAAFFPNAGSMDLGGLALDVMMLRARAGVLLHVLDQVGLADKGTEAWAKERLRQALNSAGDLETQWLELRDAILQARAVEKRETPGGVDWLRQCRSLPRVAAGSSPDGWSTHPDPKRALACERHELRRCVALRGARLEQCAGRCPSIPEQRFRPRSDDLVILRRIPGGMSR